MRLPNGVRIDSPAYPLLQAGVAYWGVTSAAGNAFGTTLVCADLDNHPTYRGSRVKVLSGGAWGQDREIMAHAAGGILTVADPFTDNTGAAQQIAFGTLFVVLSSTGGGGGGGPLSPSIGLWMIGECDPAMAGSRNTIVCPNLAGFPLNVFNDEFYMQVIHNFDAPGTAPESEIRRITDYAAGGTFITALFSANVEANDLVAIFHESIMNLEQRVVVELTEAWQDIIGGIDPNVWALTDPAGGAWANQVVGGIIACQSTLNANDVARLYIRHPWACAPTVWSTHWIGRRLVMRWEMALSFTLADLDNTQCFFGLASATNAIRTSDNLIGFCLAADVLQTLTDAAGVETTNTGFGEDLTAWNQFMIVVEAGVASFYLNDILIASHITNLPATAMYPTFYLDTEAGGGGIPRIGIVKLRLEDRP